MKLVRQLLDAKGNEVVSIDPEASVLDAIKRMAEQSIGALAVMDGERLVGIVTERDYARKVILKGRSSEGTPVREIMSTELVTTNGDETVQTCMNAMTRKKIRHLPVLDGDRGCGMISIGDLVQAVIADQQEEIEHLEHYISG